MSGCHTPEDEILALCEHLSPIKFGCKLCDEKQKHQHSLEWKLMYESVENLSERISKFEDLSAIHESNLKRKWDASSELSQRLTEVENVLKTYCLSDHDERIEEFERIMAESRLIKLEIFREETEKKLNQNHLPDCHLSLDVRILERKIQELDERTNINGYIKRIGHLGNALHSLSEENEKLKKIPHKCPVCDGQGGCYISGIMDYECLACKSKGIVWT